MRIMVIDDSKIDLFIAERLITLSDISTDIILCSSAEDGLKYLKQNCTTLEKLPELILLDIHMPEMDGFEFLEEFEQLPSALVQDIGVFLLTSSVDRKDLARSAANPLVMKLIMKPLNTEVLAQCIENYFFNQN
ncbi:response regulator [Solitalea lacus]|uniref:response regulator n=1 Tax=Solitalea lacus TaxID=2911172 RepID=UPI001EDB4C76|nr:response regulator [Solitalea lacus]UKJ09002.1 response regulator [Solitalea lacus]